MKVTEMTFKDAMELLKKNDAAMFEAFATASKTEGKKDSTKEEKDNARKAAREAAIAFANAERWARSARVRENNTSLI